MAVVVIESAIIVDNHHTDIEVANSEGWRVVVQLAEEYVIGLGMLITLVVLVQGGKTRVQG